MVYKTQVVITMLKILFVFFLLESSLACTQHKTENGFVCVCDSNNCDEVPELEIPLESDIAIFSTSATKPGFNINKASFSNINSNVQNPVVQVNDAYKPNQKIIGFGGAFTDATGQNIKRLPETAQQKLLESYFGPKGIGYSVCRVPIGGTDFSPRAYSYDDYDDDIKLEHFKLQEEDLNFKIPMIQKALKLRGQNQLNLFGTAWTAPPWMKTKKIFSRGFSMLKPENYQVWAEYIVKFFDSYKEHGINFWGVTTGNEPINGFFNNSGVNSMGWTPVEQAKWISENLGPTIRSSSHKDVKIMIHDESAIIIPFVVPALLKNKKVLEVIDGVATHWYYDSGMAPEVKNLLDTDEKELFKLSTEACYFKTAPLLGSWERAAGYISSIIEYLSYGFGGWTDWNMVLNSTGGFTYINLIADSPIIISEDATQFYKQPLFYAMGHFSKFILPQSSRLEIKQTIPDVQALAYLRPDNLVALVIFNNGPRAIDLQLLDHGRHSENITISANSINTIVYHKLS